MGDQKKVCIDGLRAARESLVRNMDFEGAAHVFDAIESLGGAAEPSPEPADEAADNRADDPDGSPLARFCLAMAVQEPAEEGKYAIVAYFHDLDSFVVFRGAVEQGA